MTQARAAAVAGTFYPGDPAELLRDVTALLAAVPPVTDKPKIIVAPHAGYIYSGPTAAHAFSGLQQRDEISRVVIFGPAHRVYFDGIAASPADAFVTPLGRVIVEPPPPGVLVSDKAHAQEHCLEVELPFLQAALPKPFTVLPLLCGNVDPEDVAKVMQAVWGGPETLILISSDLSHFLPYAAARDVDRDTSEHVLALTADLTHEQACGSTPLNAALLVAKERGMHARLLDLRNSGDTAGDKARVVGYASFAIS